MKHLFVLSDGREITSGFGADPAVQRVTLTRQVVEEKDFAYGGACAAMVEAVFLDKTGTFSPGTGEMALYAEDGEKRTLLGLFTPEQPVKSGTYTLKITAYDRMLRLDKDLTAWLAELSAWPYTLQDLLELVCSACGMELEDVRLPQGDRPVLRFLQPVTGRQIVKWIAAASGLYAAVTPEGKLTFRDFTQGGTLENPVKSLKTEEFATEAIGWVAIRQTEKDLGVSWPEDTQGACYQVVGNPLLATFSREDLLEVAKGLYEKVKGLTYTPLKAEVFDGEDLAPGTFYTLTSAAGKTYRTAVFTARYRPGLTELQSTGSPSRSGPTALASKDNVKVVQGRVAELSADLTRMDASLRETVLDVDTVKTRQTAFSMTLDGITGEVRAMGQDLSQQMTRVEQKATALEITVGTKADQTQVEELSRHFTFDGEGLTIRSGSGMGIGINEQRILFTGGSSCATEIRPYEMETTNLRVGSRLDLGQFSFFPRTNGNLSFRYTGVE